MKKLVIVTLFLTILFPNDVFAQESRAGYVVTLSGDTLHGKVKYRYNKKNLNSFVFSKDGIEKTYGPNELKTFGFLKGQQFIPYEDTFLEALVLGEVSLFRKERVFYLRKNGQDMKTVERKIITKTVRGRTYKQEDTEWVAVCAQLFNDCFQDMSTRLKKDASLNEKTITLLVLDYNSCTKKNFVEVKKNIPWIKLSYGLAAGATLSAMKFKSGLDFLPRKYSTTSLTLGVPLTFTSPRTNRRLDVQPEFYFTKANYAYRTTINNEPVHTRYHDSYISLHTFSTPVSLKFNLTEGTFATHVNIGVNLDWNLKSESHLFSEIVVDDVVNVQPERSFLEVPDFQFGFFGGLGLTRNFSSFSVGATIRYAFMTTPVKADNTNGNISKTSILIIISKR